MKYMIKKGSGFLNWVVKPISKNEDRRRKEFILRILIFGSLLLSGIATIVSTINSIFKESYIGNPPLFLFFIFLTFLTLFILSRRGFSKASAYALIIMYFIPTTYALYAWSIYVPQALLIFALLIVMSGVLVSTRFAFVVTIVVTVTLLTLSYLQSYQILKPDLEWSRTLTPQTSDGIVSLFILLIITAVSWLSNREIEKSLKRALKSEHELKKQRDLLEKTVEERTRDLQQAQAEKVTQLYRFAEFGKSASGLFHDLVGPLTLVSLNLNELHTKNSHLKIEGLANASILLKRALAGTKRLEDYVLAARKQLQTQEELRTVFLAREIRQTCLLLQYKARKARVSLSLHLDANIRIFGNPIKFAQLTTNLVSNAIDSYENVSKETKVVAVRLEKRSKVIHLEIQDWGSGIDKQYTAKIFDPLFTTKSVEKGIGIGLTICRDIAEKDLQGTINVRSKKGEGTLFTIEFPIHKNPSPEPLLTPQYAKQQRT